MWTWALFAALSAAPPTLRIESPVAGWTTARIVTLRGVAEGAAPLGVLNVNGMERPLPIEDGRFEATFALARGENAIEVMAVDPAGGPPARARLNLYAQIPRVDLQVILYWDTAQTDVDLHVREPDGTVVNYMRKEGASGGRLDRDDTDGYGPEIYSLGSAPTGDYVIKAHYFGDRGTGPTTATLHVVAREGTDEERRWRFQTALVRAGEEVVVARIQLPPAGMALRESTAMADTIPHRTRDAALPHAGAPAGGAPPGATDPGMTGH